MANYDWIRFHYENKCLMPLVLVVCLQNLFNKLKNYLNKRNMFLFESNWTFIFRNRLCNLDLVPLYSVRSIAWEFLPQSKGHERNSHRACLSQCRSLNDVSATRNAPYICLLNRLCCTEGYGTLIKGIESN